MIIKVHVTNLDINNGIQSDEFSCPIALAVCRAIQETHCYPHITVQINSIGTIRVLTGSPSVGTKVAASIPDEQDGTREDFVERFDIGRRVRPFDFEFELPDGFAE